MLSRHDFHRHYRQKAFSLVEILVVMFIIAMLSGLTFVMASTGMQTVARIEKEVAAATLAVNTPPKVRNTSVRLGSRYVVVFNDSVTDPRSEAQRICAGLDLDIVHVYANLMKGVAIKTSSAGLNALRKDPAVQYVGQEKICYASAQLTPTGIRRIGLKPKKSFGGDTSGVSFNPVVRNLAPAVSWIDGGAVNVVVVDSGVDKNHPDLNVVVNKAFGLASTDDVDGHGTHVAGIMAARNNSLGVVGACPGARIWNYRVLDDSGAGATADIIAALEDLSFFSHQIQVVNMSLGGDFDQALNDATDRLVSRGVVVCVAAGNETVDVKDTSPASARLAICVAALSDSDGRGGGRGKDCTDGDPDDTFASYSNFGDGVTVISPGTDILSTVPGGGYDFKTGTSMASPLVAGLVGVLRAPQPPTNGIIGSPGRIGNLNPIDGTPLIDPNLNGNPIPLTPAQVRTYLIQHRLELIPGLSTNSDTRKYPLVNGKGL